MPPSPSPLAGGVQGVLQGCPAPPLVTLEFSAFQIAVSGPLVFSPALRVY